MLSVFTIRRPAYRLLVGLIVLASAPAFAADVVSTWDGTTNDWTSNHWSSPNFPDNGNGGFTYDAVIGGGTVTLDQDISIDTLSGTAGTVILADGNLLTVGDNTFTTFSGAIQGSGSLSKVGTGGLTLAGTNSYMGQNTITDGTLQRQHDRQQRFEFLLRFRQQLLHQQWRWSGIHRFHRFDQPHDFARHRRRNHCRHRQRNADPQWRCQRRGRTDENGPEFRSGSLRPTLTQAPPRSLAARSAVPRCLLT